MIYSDWVQLRELESPADTTILGREYALYRIPAPEVTQDVIDGASITVYFSLLGLITPLPFTLSDISGGTPIVLTFALETGSILILSQRLTNEPYPLNLDTAFRYVIIPGGVPAETTAAPFVSTTTTIEYPEMKARFGIPDAGAGTSRVRAY